jgi:DNA mismatch endonuclease (patch repair protein)
MRRSAVQTDPVRSELMRRVRRAGTAAEASIALILSEAGMRYRKNVRSLPGSPDFANKTRRWAVFVNGCFWHHHRNCRRATIPKRNRGFWIEKFEANKARDAAKTRALRRMGFRVMTIWECELERTVPRRRITEFVRSHRQRERR